MKSVKYLHLSLIFSILFLALFSAPAFSEEEYKGPIAIKIKYLYGITAKLSGEPLIWVEQMLINEKNNEIYLFDKSNNRIVVTDMGGMYLYHFGYMQEGLKNPVQMDVDPENGEIYVAESRRVVVLNYRGRFERVVDLPPGAGGGELSIQSMRLVRDGDRAFLYIGDGGGKRILVTTLNGEYVREYGKESEVGGVILNMDVGPKEIIWLESALFTVRRISIDGKPILRFGNISSLLGGFSMPVGLSVDRERGRIIVVDANRMMVIAFDMGGNPLFEFGGPQMFSWPRAVSVDSSGHIYVADKTGIVRVFEIVPAEKPADEPVDKKEEKEGAKPGEETPQGAAEKEPPAPSPPASSPSSPVEAAKPEESSPKEIPDAPKATPSLSPVSPGP